MRGKSEKTQANQKINRVVIANLDSLEQSRTWTDITQHEWHRNNFAFESTLTQTLPEITCANDDEQVPGKQTRLSNNEVQSCMRAYCRDLDAEKNERLLSLYPEYANRFAGIMRSAYLYAENIVIPYNQLLDGIFFLSLGPQRINDMLGNFSKDNAVLVISGRAADLEHCMKSFFFTQQEYGVYTLNPMYYSMSGLHVTRSGIEKMGQYNLYLTRRLEHFDQGTDDICSIIADAFAHYAATVAADETEWSVQLFTFLTDQLRSWVQAVNSGLVAYEDQEHPHDKTSNDEKRSFGGSFIGHYGLSCDTLDRQLRKNWRLNDQEVAEVHAIGECLKRTDAFKKIRQLRFANRLSNDNLKLHDYLEDWYQYIYDLAVAELLQADLITVRATKNSFVEQYSKDNQEPGHSLSFDGEITIALGEMPDGTFADFCYAHRGTIAQWRACDSHSSAREQKHATRDISYAVGDDTEEKTFKDQQKNLGISALIVAIAAVVSAIVDSGLLTSSTMPISIIIAVIFFVNLLPTINEVLQWYFRAKSSEKTIVSLNKN